MFTYGCKILRVIDGDTVELDIDVGFRLHFLTKSRLAGINAPELSVKPAGLEARAHLELLMLNKASVMVTTVFHKEFDKYGRVLGWFVADGVAVNQQMIADGFAVASAA